MSDISVPEIKGLTPATIHLFGNSTWDYKTIGKRLCSICRVERKLSASSVYLSYSGRLQLINSVVSSLPIYFMCTLSLPKTVIEIIDKFRKNCLWRGCDINAKGYNLATWEMVTVRKDKGGLGINDLYLQNDALLL